MAKGHIKIKDETYFGRLRTGYNFMGLNSYGNDYQQTVFREIVKRCCRDDELECE